MHHDWWQPADLAAICSEIEYHNSCWEAVLCALVPASNGTTENCYSITTTCIQQLIMMMPPMPMMQRSPLMAMMQTSTHLPHTESNGINNLQHWQQQTTDQISQLTVAMMICPSTMMKLATPWLLTIQIPTKPDANPSTCPQQYTVPTIAPLCHLDINWHLEQPDNLPSQVQQPYKAAKQLIATINITQSTPLKPNPAIIESSTNSRPIPNSDLPCTNIPHLPHLTRIWQLSPTHVAYPPLTQNTLMNLAQHPCRLCISLKPTHPSVLTLLVYLTLHVRLIPLIALLLLCSDLPRIIIGHLNFCSTSISLHTNDPHHQS